MQTVLELWQKYVDETQIANMGPQELGFHRMTYYCGIAVAMMVSREIMTDEQIEPRERIRLFNEFMDEAVNWLKSIDDRAKGLSLN